MSLLSAVCISLALLIYLTYGVSSYLAFADRFDLPNAGMFSLYDTSAPFQLARLLFAFLLAFSYPLQVLPFRSSFERLLMLDESTRRAHAFKIYLASTSLLLVLTFGIAMCNPSLQKTLSLVGSMTSSVVCYILPSLYYYKAKENDPWTPTKIGALILGIFGGLVFVICTISSIVAFFL